MTDVTIAIYNLSFDRNSFEELVEEMQLEPLQQTQLITHYLNGSIEECNKSIAEKVIQIRNVAAIIQKIRPDILMMAEFNNEGMGNDLSALIGFQTHYLAVGQSSHGAGGLANLAPIYYPFVESYPTNTGLISNLDINNSGTKGTCANHTWGFGCYHGQYAFALMSKYQIDNDNTRTFQQFKWKDLTLPTTISTVKSNYEYYKALFKVRSTEYWYSDTHWPYVRLSSKNHVDVPIVIPIKDGKETIHLLMSHPTPPVFDSGKNRLRNAAEVIFWHQYIQNESNCYDDFGNIGGLEQSKHFVIIGDLNLDPIAGDGISAIIQALHNDPLINQNVTNGKLYPSSQGAVKFVIENNKIHPKPERITSTFGLNVDHVIPSSTLNIIDSGIYWPNPSEADYKLFHDKRLGQSSVGKNISSDHRMVWIKARL